jgi:hypothetical protein
VIPALIHRARGSSAHRNGRFSFLLAAAENADHRYLISLRRLFARLVQSDVDLPGFPGLAFWVEIGAFDVES